MSKTYPSKIKKTNESIIKTMLKYRQNVGLICRQSKSIKVYLECDSGHKRTVKWPPKSKECPICKKTQRKKKTEKKILKKVNARGGRVLNIKNNRIEIMCKNEHTWSVSISNFLHQNTWCKKCHIKNLYDSRLLKVKKEIKNNNGILLTYNKEQLKIKCQFGHEWCTTKQIIIAKSWCPTCSTGKSERICRAIFESIFKHKFIKVRLDCLKSSKTNRNLELDGYCKELGVAFEYNGPHHYQPIYGKNNLNKTRQNDKLKAKLCKNAGIKLLTIQHKDGAVSTIKKDILKSLNKNNIPFNNSDPKISYKNTISGDRSIAKIKNILETHNLKCLTNAIRNVHDKILVRCKQGHTFKRSAYHILYSKKSVCLNCKYKNK